MGERERQQIKTDAERKNEHCSAQVYLSPWTLRWNMFSDVNRSPSQPVMLQDLKSWRLWASQEETSKWGCQGSGPGDKGTAPLDKSCQSRSLSTVCMCICHPKEIKIKRNRAKFQGSSKSSIISGTIDSHDFWPQRIHYLLRALCVCFSNLSIFHNHYWSAKFIRRLVEVLFPQSSQPREALPIPLTGATDPVV